jgi:hypothetical protein
VASRVRSCEHEILDVALSGRIFLRRETIANLVVESSVPRRQASSLSAFLVLQQRTKCFCPCRRFVFEAQFEGKGRIQNEGDHLEMLFSGFV